LRYIDARAGGRNARQIARLPHQRFRLPLPSSKLFKTINIHFVPCCFQPARCGFQLVLLKLMIIPSSPSPPSLDEGVTKLQP